MIKSLYCKVLAAIKLQTDTSSFFEISFGVKQGEPLSLLLFILFVNDVHSEFSQSFDADSEEINGINIQQMCLILQLFADDRVLFSTDPVELQFLLNKLYKCSTEWGLKVNTSKTKLCVFFLFVFCCCFFFFQKRRSNIYLVLF